MKCSSCGGNCEDIGGGKYRCECCRQVFSQSDFAVSRSTAATRVNTSRASIALDGADIFEKNIGGVLEIFCRGARSSWSGSGYIVTYDGYAVTNAHVAANDDGSPCRDITVKVGGKSVSATVIALADDRAGQGSGVDLAVIKLSYMPSGAHKVELGDYSAVRNGEAVYVIGNSLGQGACITSGIVSDRARRVSGTDMLMTDCAVNGGNSGGPIFDKNGRVIGTITLQGRAHDGGDAEGMNYAIPISTVLNFIRKYVRI